MSKISHLIINVCLLVERGKSCQFGVIGPAKFENWSKDRSFMAKLIAGDNRLS